MMNEIQGNFLGFLRVFVYGTLKPGEANYQRYCAERLVRYQEVYTLGQLYGLPVGYPAMTIGKSRVGGYLLEFAESEVLAELDILEDYQSKRETSENLYSRQQVEIFNLNSETLGQAWAYLMDQKQIYQLKGVLQPDGWWSSCGKPAIDD